MMLQACLPTSRAQADVLFFLCACVCVCGNLCFGESKIFVLLSWHTQAHMRYNVFDLDILLRCVRVMWVRTWHPRIVKANLSAWNVQTSKVTCVFMHVNVRAHIRVYIYICIYIYIYIYIYTCVHVSIHEKYIAHSSFVTQEIVKADILVFFATSK
jgi:hypothetical protein